MQLLHKKNYSYCIIFIWKIIKLFPGTMTNIFIFQKNRDDELEANTFFTWNQIFIRCTDWSLKISENWKCDKSHCIIYYRHDFHASAFLNIMFTPWITPFHIHERICMKYKWKKNATYVHKYSFYNFFHNKFSFYCNYYWLLIS